MGRRAHRAAALLIVALSMGAAPLSAQAGMGRVMGRVLSAQTGEPLAAVQVSVPSISRGTLSDATGRFVLMNVPAGVHTLQASSLGYGTKTVVGVEIAAGEPTRLDISLDAQAVALEGVTVSAARERGNSASLLADRRTSAGVSDAIGADQISRAPDGDAAAVLKRVPGVSVVDGKYVYVRGLGERYGATTLNGSPMPSPLPDRKTVPLDVIPSSLLESVVTAKTYSPDQPGDYAGGLVQIQTRTVPGEPMLRLSASVGYTPDVSLEQAVGFHGGRYDFLGFDDGSRSLPESVFRQERVTLPGDGAARAEMAEALTRRFGTPAMEFPLNQSYGLAFGNELPVLGRRLGVVGSVSVSDSYAAPGESVERLFVAAGDEPRQDLDFDILGGTRESSLGALLGLSAELAPGHRVTATGTYNRLTEDQSREFAGAYGGGDYFETYQTRYVANALANGQLRGDHLLPLVHGATLGWRASFGRADRDEPGTRTTAYRGAGPGEPTYFLGSQSSGLVLAQRLDETVVSGAIDTKIPFTLRGLPASVSFGASTDLRDRGVETRRILLNPVGTFDGEVLALRPGELFVPERIGDQPGQFQVEDRTFPADNYEADQTILGAFAMAEAEILPRVRVAGGVRVEQAEQNVAVTGYRTGEGGDIPPTALENTDLIPSLTLTYAPTGSMNLRAAVSRTLARPQFRELSPFLYADYFGGVPVRGNPFLERSRILNADARWEWFPGFDAVISAGAFYKAFDKPIEPVAILLGTNPGRTFANTESATVYGAELEVRTPLEGLAPVLSGFTINGNLTLASSSVSGDEVLIYDPQSSGALAYPIHRGGSRPLFGQSPYVANVGLGYFHERTSTTATLLFNRFGRRVETTGGVSLPDIYEEGRSQLDLTLEQELRSGLTMKLSMARLLGGDVRFTQAFPNGDVVTTRAYDLGRTFSVSLGWQP